MNRKTIRKVILVPFAAVAAVLFFAAALDSLDSGRADESQRQLEEALRRACVACYAAEGVYPPDLDYLAAHYGVQIDETNYIVHYMRIADNLMPDITVIRAAAGEGQP